MAPVNRHYVGSVRWKSQGQQPWGSAHRCPQPICKLSVCVGFHLASHLMAWASLSSSASLSVGATPSKALQQGRARSSALINATPIRSSSEEVGERATGRQAKRKQRLSAGRRRSAPALRPQQAG